MEGDVVASLLVDAAVEGLVDFRQARIFDSAWTRRLRVLLDGLQRRKNYVVADAIYKANLARVSNGSLTPDSFSQVQKDVQESFYDLVGTIRPWEGETYGQRKSQEFADYREDYKAAFGWDPYSDEFKEWEVEQIKKYREERHQRRLEQEAEDAPFEAALKRVLERQQERKQQGRR